MPSESYKHHRFYLRADLVKYLTYLHTLGVERKFIPTSLRLDVEDCPKTLHLVKNFRIS